MCLPAVPCVAAAQTASKTDLHMGYVHIQMCWNNANILSDVPNFKVWSYRFWLIWVEIEKDYILLILLLQKQIYSS